MKRLTTFASIAALMLIAACTTNVTTANPQSVAENDYRISVEIPLEGTEFEDQRILRVDELLDERTEFDSGDFQLDEVVLVARSESAQGSPDATGHAELLVLEWRSGAFDVPAGDEDDWYEVRIPAPEDDPGGAWLLDVSGDVAVDFLVVVMEPRAQVAADETVYRTRTVVRNVPSHRAYPVYPAYSAYSFYDPTRYYVYHYYDDLWPYRYFAGVWDYRYYHVGFRPSYHRFSRYYGPRYDHVQLRNRYRADRRRYRHGRDSLPWRLRNAGDPRPRARYDAPSRSNPRLRTFRDRGETRSSADTRETRKDSARSRYREDKRTHPRLRQFHRDAAGNTQEDSDRALGQRRQARDRVGRNTSAVESRAVQSQSAARERASPTRRRAPVRPAATPSDGGLGNDYGASRRASAQQATQPRTRIPTLRNSASRTRPAAVQQARTRPVATSRPSRAVSPRPTQGADRRSVPSPRASAPPARQQTRATRSTSGNVRTRSFHPRPTAATRQAPARSSARPSSRANVSRPAAERPAPTRSATARSARNEPRSSDTRESRSSNPRRGQISR